MDLRNAACKKLIEHKVVPAIEEEWRNMWHNASILHHWPDYDDSESDLFWEWLCDTCHWFIENLKEAIEGQWGFDWEIYQWGRSGTTIAPDGFASSHLGHLSRSIDIDKIVAIEDCFEYDDGWIDAYDNLTSHLAAFKFINESVRGTIKAIKDMWADFKKNNFEG